LASGDEVSRVESVVRDEVLARLGGDVRVEEESAQADSPSTKVSSRRMRASAYRIAVWTSSVVSTGYAWTIRG
jgi:hypothetical protein